MSSAIIQRRDTFNYLLFGFHHPKLAISRLIKDVSSRTRLFYAISALKAIELILRELLPVKINEIWPVNGSFNAPPKSFQAVLSLTVFVKATVSPTLIVNV